MDHGIAEETKLQNKFTNPDNSADYKGGNLVVTSGAIEPPGFLVGL